ncbi:uncharacterized protein LOC123505584 isoform X1 [Portunus trituberculatus]|uniref:uncharacterized protein LOC123505584 isoform X1 n=1 Tax=Portunus trituberculatus TaxID=210409 RepID=UPI001E1CCE19|nr:uncharacterized protein LOC123505584 isoform X1 [Portunus trituberculatus]
MERRLKLKSLKRVYSQKVTGAERRDVGLRSPGAPKKPLVKSLSMDWRLNLGSPLDPGPPALHRIDELDLSSSQHLCRSATCPSVPTIDPQASPLPSRQAPESVRSSPATSGLRSLGRGVGTPLVRSHEDPGPTTPGSDKRPHRGLRRTRSRPEGPAPSFGPRSAAAVESGGSLGASVGGTIKRYVSLLRSRSAVSHRERPILGRISPGESVRGDTRERERMSERD